MHRVHDLAAVRLAKVKLDDQVSIKRNLNFPEHDYSSDAFVKACLLASPRATTL